MMLYGKVLQTRKQKLEPSTKDSSSKEYLGFVVSKHSPDLDASRDVERLQHVARNEQRRNDVERDRHLVETTSEHLNESVADEP